VAPDPTRLVGWSPDKLMVTRPDDFLVTSCLKRDWAHAERWGDGGTIDQQTARVVLVLLAEASGYSLAREICGLLDLD
jgi:hypothetical protein